MKYATVREYLIANPIKQYGPGCYAEIARMFNTTTDAVRLVNIRLRKRGLANHPNDNPEPKIDQAKLKVDAQGNASISSLVHYQIKNEQELVHYCQIDLEKWCIKEWECTSWNMGAKIKQGKNEDLEIKTLYRVWAKLVPRRVETDLTLQKDFLLEELRSVPMGTPQDIYEQYYRMRGERTAVSRRKLLFEPCIFDLHIGKHTWREETGEEYNMAEAVKRFMTAQEVLLNRVDVDQIGHILIPIGNDMVHVDNRQHTTSNGTPQDTDGRYFQMIRTCKNMLIDTVDKLLSIAPVDIVVVSGNHDFSTMFSIGEILDAYYHHNKFVNVINPPSQRKYYQFGQNGFMFTHGDEEKISDLPLIFATANAPLWAATKFRQVQIGHFHKKKEIRYNKVDTFAGAKVKILSSLSGTDAYHSRKGYMAEKQAEAMLFDPHEGQIGEFFYNL